MKSSWHKSGYGKYNNYLVKLQYISSLWNSQNQETTGGIYFSGWIPWCFFQNSVRYIKVFCILVNAVFILYLLLSLDYPVYHFSNSFFSNKTRGIQFSALTSWYLLMITSVGNFFECQRHPRLPRGRYIHCPLALADLLWCVGNYSFRIVGIMQIVTYYFLMDKTSIIDA